MASGLGLRYDTAQRISDYNNIKKEDIHTTTKRWIEDVPDSKKKGQTKAVIRTKEITYIDIHQKKTGAKVSIPCKKELLAILEKYRCCEFPNFRVFPPITNQEMNRSLKDLCELCEINTPIPVTCYRYGEREDKVYYKYQRVGTHAARKTFICFALSIGVPPDVVMKWTGHSDYESMKPYIAICDRVKSDAMKKIGEEWGKYDGSIPAGTTNDL